MTSYPQATLRVSLVARRYRPGHQYHNGFLQHAFATSPWLGAIVIALITLVGLVLAPIKKAAASLKTSPGMYGWPS
jgi:hypothetical protein